MTLEHFLSLIFGDLIIYFTNFLNLMRDAMGMPPITDEDVTA